MAVWCESTLTSGKIAAFRLFSLLQKGHVLTVCCCARNALKPQHMQNRKCTHTHTRTRGHAHAHQRVHTLLIWLGSLMKADDVRLWREVVSSHVGLSQRDKLPSYIQFMSSWGGGSGSVADISSNVPCFKKRRREKKKGPIWKPDVNTMFPSISFGTSVYESY